MGLFPQSAEACVYRALLCGSKMEKEQVSKTHCTERERESREKAGERHSRQGVEKGFREGKRSREAERHCETD